MLSDSLTSIKNNHQQLNTLKGLVHVLVCWDVYWEGYLVRVDAPEFTRCTMN